MNGADQWYYLAGNETRGPVPAEEIVRLIRGGSLPPAALVAQAGWQTWSPASQALANLLNYAPPGAQYQAGAHPGAGGFAPQGPQAGAIPVEAPTYAIRLQCVSGPDAGKAYMIGVAEVSLGRVSGIGERDPQIAGNHVVVSWQNNVLHFRAFPGVSVRVAGVDVTQGTLSNGQQFQMGASIWQVGSAPVELSNLLSNLGSKLSQLTSTEKLEGFSLTTMFSEVFKGRKRGEVEDYLVVGTSKTTPALDEMETGWPKPWFFMRVLGFMALVYLLFSKGLDYFPNPIDLPGTIIIGAFTVPLAVVVLFWELNTPRNVTLLQVLALVALGGGLAFLLDDFVVTLSHLGLLGALSPGICEETAKLFAVVLVARNLKHKYILNGIVFGAAIGAGFAAFETAGYAFYYGYLMQFMQHVFTSLARPSDYWSKAGVQDWNAAVAYLKEHTRLTGEVLDNIKDFATLLSNKSYTSAFGTLQLRAWQAPFTHIAWTAITAGAFWRVKGANPASVKMFADPFFVRVFLIPVILHTTWDLDFVNSLDWLYRGLVELGIGVAGWYWMLRLVQQGLKQIKAEQVAHIQTEYTKTRETLTTSGRFRVQTIR